MKTLNFKGYVYLVILFIINYVYVLVDQEFIPETYRPFALAVFTLITLMIFFIIVKPEKPYVLSKLISFLLGGFVLIILIITHVIITFNISYKGVVILGVTMLMPFLAGFIYKKLLIF